MKKHLPLSVKSIVFAIVLLFSIQFCIAQQSYFGGNILPNPGFEDSFTGNWQWDETVLSSTGEGSISQVTGDTTEGSKKLLIDVTAPGFDVNNAAALNVFDGSLLNGFAGRWYMALDAKSSNDTTPLKVGLMAYHSNGTDKTNAPAIVLRKTLVDTTYITQDYMRYHGYTYTRSTYLGGNGEVRVMAGEQIGEVSVDNMELRAVLDIVNGGFEEDSLLFGWELEGSNAVASLEDNNVVSGNRALMLTVDSVASITNQYFHNVETDGSNDTITYNVMGDPGDTVALTVVPWGEKNYASWKVIPEQYNEIELEKFVLPPEADTSYIEHTVIIPFDLFADTVGAIFHQYGFRFIGDGTYYLDDVNYSSAYTEPTIRFALQNTTIEIGNEFNHFIQYTGDGNISLSFSTDASWLSFNNDTISGTPQLADTGTYNVKVVASNGISSENDTTSCIITVYYNAPEIASIDDDSVLVNTSYSKNVTINGAGIVSITPEWLLINPEGEITGTPDTVGEFLVKVSVNDQIGPIVYEEYNLIVYEESSNLNSNIINGIKIYPNPASDVIHITNALGAFVSIYNISGINVLDQTLNDSHLINIQHLEPGLYIISVKTNSGTTTQTLRIQ